MRTPWFAVAVISLGISPASMALASCEGRGGPAGCDHASNSVLCTDGTLDKRFPCSGKRQGQRNSKPRELKLKPPNTNRGQILSPGQKPPDTSLKDSK